MREARSWGNGAAVVVLALSVAACGGSEARAVEGDAAGELRRIVNVEVETAVVAPFTDRLNVIGVVAANRDVTVGAEEGGVVRALLVERGAYVRAGQPIVRVDDALLRVQVRQTKADADLAAETWDRQRRLWETERIGTELAYLQSKFAAERTSAQLAFLTERLERTVVRAPIDGILDARLVEVGATVAPGAPVARIVDISTVKVIGGIPERYASDVRRGAGATIMLDALGGRSFTGRIDYVGSVVDAGDRTFPVEVVVANPGGLIKPGLVANVAVDRRMLEQAVQVPQGALVRAEDGYVVYIVADEGGETIAQARSVVAGTSQGGRVVIDSGLAGGERVIIVGQQKVAPGDLLRIVGNREVPTP